MGINFHGYNTSSLFHCFSCTVNTSAVYYIFNKQHRAFCCRCQISGRANNIIRHITWGVANMIQLAIQLVHCMYICYALARIHNVIAFLSALV